MTQISFMDGVWFQLGRFAADVTIFIAFAAAFMVVGLAVLTYDKRRWRR